MTRKANRTAISLVGSVYFKWRRVPRQRVCCISASWQTEPPRSGIEREGGGKKKTASGSGRLRGASLVSTCLSAAQSSINHPGTEREWRRGGREIERETVIE
uniref:Uncharacterized protein n=1 Tax=Oncorhynchus mykiss TaxID=8022 RepID=A0A8K9ULB3_ONCMY